MVVTQDEPLRPLRVERAEMLRDALPDRLQRLPAVGAGRRVDADELARAGVNGDEDIGAALGRGDRLRHVRAPDLVHPLRHDRPVMGVREPWRWPVGRQQAVLLHEPPHPPRRRPDAA